MRFPWQKPIEEEYYEGARPKRPRETLSQVAERILVRKMKKDPDNYGLKAAERLKGVVKDETDLAGQLKEFRELRNLLKDLSGESEGKGSVLKDIAEIIQTLPQAMQALGGMQGQGMQGQGYPGVEQVQQPQLQQPPQPSPRAVKEPPEEKSVTIYQLGEFLEMEPAEAATALRNTYPEWVAILSVQSYEGIMSQVEPFKDTNSEIYAIVERLSSPTGKMWVESVITLLKTGGKPD